MFQTASHLKKSLQSDTKQIKIVGRNLNERWAAKRLHGQFLRNLD